MKCKMCNAKMKERESHNGFPLCDDRVCRNCNYFVTATRMFAISEEAIDLISLIMNMAFSLKRMDESFIIAQPRNPFEPYTISFNLEGEEE